MPIIRANTITVYLSLQYSGRFGGVVIMDTNHRKNEREHFQIVKVGRYVKIGAVRSFVKMNIQGKREGEED